MSWKSYRRSFEMRPLCLLVLCVLPVFANGLELAVGTSRGPAILKSNGQNYMAERIGGYAMHDVLISSVAVDVIHNRLFFAYTEPHYGVLVHSVSLTPNEEDDPILDPVIKQGQGPLSIRSLVYDEVDDALYWTDSTKNEISMIKLSQGDQNATILHNFKSEEPEKHLAGIAIDICHGLLFWTNNNHESPSLERSYLNGSNLKVIISSDIFLPMAVTVDPSGNGRLFWVDKMEGSEYKIETSKLDGSGRDVLVKGYYQRPYSVSYVPLGGNNVQDGVIVWLDYNHFQIWELEIKNGGKARNKGPRKIYEFERDSAMALVAMSSSNVTNHITCMITSARAEEANTTLTKKDSQSAEMIADKPGIDNLPPFAPQEVTTLMENPETPSSEVDRLELTTISQHELSSTTGSPKNGSFNANLLRFRFCDDYCINGEPEEDCRNGGPVVCKCHRGYSGLRCEVNLCSNFCLHGSCSLEGVSDGYWQPKCSCRVGFTGARCERDPCRGYCLNSGRCRVEADGQPKCTCLGNGRLAKGERCEQYPNLLKDICGFVCSMDSSKTSVSIVQLEGKDRELADAEGPVCICPPGSTNYVTKGGVNATTGGELVPSSETLYSIIVSPIYLITVGVCLVLFVITLFLLYKVMKLRRLPRIKKRIIVSKGSVPLAAGCGTVVRGRGSPSRGGAGSPIVEEQQQCEITIENCCNMNVCETPCFEPQLRSPGKSSSSKKNITHEEKKGLLGNMEIPKNSCGPCPGAEELY